MPTFQRFLHLFVFVVFLLGCSEMGSPDAFELSTPVGSQPVSLGTDLESPLAVTATPSPSITPSQTQASFDRAAYDATQSVVQTKVAHFPRVCTEEYFNPRYSPNDLWMEEICASENDLILTLSNRETRVLWKLFYQDYIPTMDFVPDGGLRVNHWSNDGRYAYFYSFSASDGGECFYEGGDRGFGLFRIDLQSGQTAAVLPLSTSFWWYGFSISPTDRRLVYGERARDLKTLDITTGHSIPILSASNFDEAGGFLWSADGLKLVYSTAMSDHQAQTRSYTVRLVDVRTGSERILLEDFDTCYAAKSWGENNTLILEKNYNEAFIEFDLNSNEIVRETTPPS